MQPFNRGEAHEAHSRASLADVDAWQAQRPREPEASGWWWVVVVAVVAAWGWALGYAARQVWEWVG